MNILRKLFLFASLSLASAAIYAQNYDFKITDKGVIRSVELSDGTEEQYTILKPIMVLKTKYELSTEEGYSRFSVKNARLGLQGDASKVFSYRFQVDFCAENKLSVLDLYATIKPFNRLSFTVGQQGLSLFNSWTVSPNAVDFINRPFIGKYFTSSRDIGVSAKYAIKQNGFPINLELGVYNGSGINNPTWSKSVATGGRLEFGSTKEGFRTSAKFYNVKDEYGETNLYWGADLRYLGDDIKLEAEYMCKEIGDFSLSSTYFQALYKIKSNCSSLKRVEPLLRWDAMGYNLSDSGFGVNRITAGFNFVLNTSITSMFRVNYEHYFNNSMDMSDLFKNGQYNENKLSVEYLIYF